MPHASTSALRRAASLALQPDRASVYLTLAHLLPRPGAVGLYRRALTLLPQQPNCRAFLPVRLVLVLMSAAALLCFCSCCSMYSDTRESKYWRSNEVCCNNLSADFGRSFI